MHLADPPSLDLPPPKHRFEYGGQSLPNGGGRYAPAWTINYQPDPLASPLVSATDATTVAAKDLPYRRKPGRLHSAVPSPLYFRQKAAAAHSSPAFNPTSPSARFVGLPTMADFSGAHVHEDDIAALTLPGQCESAELPALVPPPSHCGRPGCVGVPKRPKLETSVSGLKASRRLSGPGSPALRGLAPLDTSDDVLLSPRIRALRTGHHSPVEPREAPQLSSPDEEEHDPHSAFACYLFSHLSTDAPVERGRSASIDQSGPDMQRSLSVDAAIPSRAVANSSPSASMSPAPRQRRAMFGGRGPAALNARTEPALRPLTPTPTSPVAADEDVPLSSTLRGRDLDRDATIRPSMARGRGSERAKLTPGHYIAATTETPSGVSPFPSPPPSPPTAGRGRSLARRQSDAADAAPSADSRGRSGTRGHGAVKRSMSPSARKTSPSPSPSRSRSRSRVSHSRSRGRLSAPAERGRGRTRERTVEEDPSEHEAAADADDEVERRGRGRSCARGSRSRSRSQLRRGRGREVVYSMAAYGHCDSSEEDR